MASPAQIIRHKFLQYILFTPLYLVLVYFYCTSQSRGLEPYIHLIVFIILFRILLLNGLWVVSGALSLLGLYDVLQK